MFCNYCCTSTSPHATCGYFTFAAVTLEVTEPEVLVNEGDGVARVCARMIGMADFPIRAVFTTTDDSAQSPSDFNNSPRGIEFPAHSDSPQCAEIPLNDDNIVEFRETFSVILLAGTHHSRVRIGENNTAVVTIEDNDCRFKLLHSELLQDLPSLSLCSC